MDSEAPEVDGLEKTSTVAPRQRRAASGSRWRDVVIFVGAVGAVVLAILAVQAFRNRGGDKSAALAVAADGGYTALGVSNTGSSKVGDPAKDFRLVDVDGNIVQLADWRGRVVLLNFWATWCVPCRREIPDLIRLQETWGEPVQILGLDVQESRADVASFRTEFGINYPLILDSDGQVTTTYGIYGLPETWFIDASGVIRDHRLGQLRPELASCIVAGIQAGNYNPKSCR